MVSVGVSALDRTSIHFVEPGVRVNGRYYRDVLLMQELLPDIRQLSEIYVFQQDSVPVHRAREAVDLFTKETPDFIRLTLWPPNSPDLNTVDYKVWSVMQEKVYTRNESRISTKFTAWDELVQRVIDTAVRLWCTRLSACVKAKGGHFEYKQPVVLDRCL